MSDLQNLKAIPGLNGAQRAFLLQMSPSLLNHAEKGRRSLNALSLAFLEEASRILLSMPRFQIPETHALSESDLLRAKKLFNKAKADTEKKKDELRQLKIRLQQAHDKKTFASALALEPELAGRNHVAFCQNLTEEADSEIALLSPLLLIQKEAELKGLEAQVAYLKRFL